MSLSLATSEPRFLPRTSFHKLLVLLEQQGYQCIGPTERDGAIGYTTISSVKDFPAGVQITQRPANYTILHTGISRWFAWSNGPQALKPLLFSPREPLWKAERDIDGVVNFNEMVPENRPMAVIGVRPCDLAALRLQHQHFIEGQCFDHYYGARCRDLFLVAVNCTHPSETCFCASTGDGPGATDGFDVLLDELDNGFVFRAGTQQGESIIEKMRLAPADKGQLYATNKATAEAAESQVRSIPSRNLQHALFANLDHPRWEQVAGRCLACGNCTAVCPTCFCYRERDEAQLDGKASLHRREWDSCFSQDHSYISGKTIRLETRLRYRQWLTHKLGSWHEQYGRSGCVGCGRCITWCPVEIDITEETSIICGEVNDYA